MVWAIVLALFLVLVGLPLVLAALTSRGFWLAVFLCACAGVVLYSCQHDTTAPRARKLPRAELDARFQEWERRHAPAAPAPSP